MCAAATCPRLLTNGFWTGSGCDSVDSFLLMVLARDTYPHNWAADYQCGVTSKWTAFGAEYVGFVDTDLAHVTLIKVGNAIIVNYRGSDSEVDNANNDIWKFSKGEGSYKLLGGTVETHPGWTLTLEAVYPTLVDAINELIRSHGLTAPQLYITGHSRGGAMSHLTAARFVNDYPNDLGKYISKVVTYGSPIPGDKGFAQAYVSSPLGSKTCRWWHQIDNIPYLPPVGGYTPLSPEQTLYRIWQDQGSSKPMFCGKASGNLLKSCPSGRCNFAYKSTDLPNHHETRYMNHLRACLKPALGDKYAAYMGDACYDALFDTKWA